MHLNTHKKYKMGTAEISKSLRAALIGLLRVCSQWSWILTQLRAIIIFFLLVVFES